MVTRQLRLNTKELIRTKLRGFIGKKINIVLSNHSVLFGELRSITDTQLTFANMRLQLITLSLADINEVYLDFKE